VPEVEIMYGRQFVESFCEGMCLYEVQCITESTMSGDGRGPDRCEKRRDRAQRGTFLHHEHETRKSSLCSDLLGVYIYKIYTKTKPLTAKKLNTVNSYKYYTTYYNVIIY
jgi:hypothetical protein